MKSNDKLKQTDIKNHTCYYFDDITNIEALDVDNILVDENSNENILIYDVLHKTLYGAKPICIISDKVDGYIRKYKKASILINILKSKIISMMTDL